MPCSRMKSLIFHGIQTGAGCGGGQTSHSYVQIMTPATIPQVPPTFKTVFPVALAIQTRARRHANATTGAPTSSTNPRVEQSTTQPGLPRAFWISSIFSFKPVLTARDFFVSVEYVFNQLSLRHAGLQSQRIN